MFDFVTWMRGQVEERGGTADKTLILVEPTADLPEQIVSARRAGVENIVCGFLPDEVEWWAPAGGGSWEWFLTRWLFVPFWLETGLPSGAATQTGVLLVQDRGARDGTETAVAQLAAAIADAQGETLSQVDARSTALASLAEKVCSAGFVINAVQNWQLGFAVDELAAREGVRILRLEKSGYSPLRHALLGQHVHSPAGEGVPHLRQWLSAAMWLRDRERDRVDAREWFQGAEAANNWRRLFDSLAAQRFWGDFRPSNGESTDDGESSRWLNRWAAWAALATAADGQLFPTDAFERAEEVVAELVVTELKKMTPGSVRSAALPRWVRLRPGWLARFHRQAAGMREAMQLMERWVMGLGVPGLGAPSRSLLEAVVAAIGPGRIESKPFAVAVVWSGDWERLPALMSQGPKLEASLRRACVALCWERCNDLESLLPIDHGHAAVLSDENVWIASMGAAGPALRIVVAWRLREFSLGIRGWREARRTGRVPAEAGLGRIIHAVTGDSRVWLAWLTGLTGAEMGEWNSAVEELLARWFQVRLPDLWRRTHTKGVARELRLVNVISEKRCARKDPSARTKRMYIIGLALAGRAGEALRVFDGIGINDNAVREAAGHAALAMWLNGNHSECRAILAAGSQPGEEPPQVEIARATVFQLLGDLDLSSAALARLNTIAPGYLSQGTTADTRWSWVALVCRRAGLEAEAERFLAFAKILMPGSERAFSDVESSNLRLAEGWRTLGGFEEGAV